MSNWQDDEPPFKPRFGCMNDLNMYPDDTVIGTKKNEDAPNEQKKLDLSKPVRFRNEPDWKIISIVENPLGNESCKIIVNAINRNGQVDCWFCKADGCFVSDDHESKIDLVNTEIRYINVYGHGITGSAHISRQEADTNNVMPDRIAVLRIDLDTKTAHLEPV